MACLDNSSSSSSSSSPSCPPLMSPRISFSNDFAESHYQLHHQQQQQVMRNPRDDPARISDFEFSVTNNYSMSMMTTADELFFKGQFLPFKPTHKPTTLRDELLVDEDDHHQVSHRRPKTSTRWKGFLGLKKAHIASKTTKTSPPPPPPMDNNAFDFTGTVE